MEQGRADLMMLQARATATVGCIESKGFVWGRLWERPVLIMAVVEAVTEWKGVHSLGECVSLLAVVLLRVQVLWTTKMQMPMMGVRTVSVRRTK